MERWPESVAVAGSSTLDRFTKGILEEGLCACGVAVARTVTAATPLLLQVHGAPEASDEDAALIAMLAERLGDAHSAPVAVLVHRPDEVQSRHPQLKDAMEGARRPFALLFLGDLHLNDPFFAAPAATRGHVPHGFFSAAPLPPAPPFVVGTHTRYGEMRTVADTLAVVAATLVRLPAAAAVGYLGGSPADAISVEAVEKLLATQGLASEVELLQWTGELDPSPPTLPRLYLGTPTAPPPPVHFNVQLYHLGGRVRTGENSGSLHTWPSVPVVVEMNGGERLEELKVIKVARSPSSDLVADCDFAGAGAAVAAAVTSGDVAGMLTHNLARAEALSPQAVAAVYLGHLAALARQK